MFPDTPWTLVAAASLSGDSAGRRALESLCQAYWPAVATFLQSRGHDREEAEDITQEFFSALVESRLWERADQSRGRFRNFLLGALMRSISTHWRHQQAAKRGGGVVALSLNELEDVGIEISVADDGDRLRFDHAWAVRLLERAMERLAEEWEDEAELQMLQRFLPLGDDAPAYENAASELGCTLAALKSRVLRFRGRFREHIESEVARTVHEPHEIAGELQHLERVLAAPDFERPIA
jgi:RNA polymerase sigma factor (sigma-70 family)